MNSFELQKLSNTQLDQILKQAVSKERELLTEILIHIAEVDRRKLFLTFAYSSLFDYLTKHVGYSAGSAQRRIDAARLSKEIPEVIHKLEQGSLNLAQIGLIQKSVRQSQSETKSKITVQIKKQIVEALCKKSFAESQILVSRSLNISAKAQPKTIHQQDESVRLELTLTKSQWKKLNQARELLSNSLPNGTWDQVLECALDEVIVKRTPKTNVSTKASKSENPSNNSAHQIVVKIPAGRAPLSKKIRDQILHRDQCCQFIDKNTGKMCSSKWRLQVDHIQPVWSGGQNAIHNLRALCANHNLEIYRSQAGIIHTSH